MSKNSEILRVRNLKTYFAQNGMILKAVDGVSLVIHAGQTVCLVGESGCGKSVTALSITRLISCPPAVLAEGEVMLNGRSLAQLTQAQLREVRGNEVSLIFQNPMSALNPLLKCGEQIRDVILSHRKITPADAVIKAFESLDKVGLDHPERRYHQYPFELSGGMQQRVLIAMALACEPALLIADEPTTALDVSTQTEIVALLRSLQSQNGMAMLFITHNLDLASTLADRIEVMYASQIVESISRAEILTSARHPYTQGLLRSQRYEKRDGRYYTIKGDVPDATNLPAGCHFEPRCSWATDKCRTFKPVLEPISENHQVACWEHERVGAGSMSFKQEGYTKSDPGAEQND